VESPKAPETPVIDPRRLPAEDPPGTGLWLAAGRDGDLRLVDLGGELVVAGAGVMARVGVDGSLEALPAMHHGMLEPEWMGVEVLMALGGRWPDPVWMTAQSQAHRSASAPFTYYRKGARWQRKATGVGPLDWYYQAFAPWTGEQTLALRLLTTDPNLESLYGDDLPAKIRKQIDAAIRANPPRLDLLAAGTPPKPAPMQIAAGSRPIDLATLPTGEVFVLLAFAENEGGEDERFAVQRFAPGEPAGVVDHLPEVGGAAPFMPRGKLVARAANDVYLAGALRRNTGLEALVTRFDGETWRPITLPPGGQVLSLAFAADGVAWAVVERMDAEGHETTGLWKRPGEGAWTEVTLPRVRTPALAEPRFLFDGDELLDWREAPGEPLRAAQPMAIEPGQVAVHDGELWVLASVPEIGHGDQSRQVVLRSRPVQQILELTDSVSLGAEMSPGSLATSLDPKRGCNTGSTWVVVATIASGTDRDAGAAVAESFLASLPDELREGLVALRDFRVRGRRVVAATMGFHDMEATMALAEATRRIRPDEKHPFECGNPRPIRSFHEHD
ncbi:MAG TPA: hypothetical protein VGB85_28720, partial [Nannocystis sp.]